MQVNCKRGVVTFKALSVDRRRVADAADVVDAIERNVKGRDPVKHAIAETTLAGLREIEKWIAEPKAVSLPLFDENKNEDGEENKTNVEGDPTPADVATTDETAGDPTPPNVESSPADQHEGTGGGRGRRRKSGDHSAAT